MSTVLIHVLFVSGSLTAYAACGTNNIYLLLIIIVWTNDLQRSYDIDTKNLLMRCTDYMKSYDLRKEQVIYSLEFYSFSWELLANPLNLKLSVSNFFYIVRQDD